MAQLIRKFSTGGTADPAPLKALGNYYNVDEFRREMLGPKADSYIKAMGLNSAEAAQFKQDLLDHVDEIIAGTMHVSDNHTLVNNSNNWENDGLFKKINPLKWKWKLSEEDKKNNRSIHVTNYILGSLEADNVKKYSPSGILYTLNFDSLFKDRMHPGMDIDDYWETWDALDETSPDQKDKKGNIIKKGEKGTKNRLKHIADILIYEADRLDNDVNYRNESTWNGWENKWEGRQLETSNRLRQAAKNITDGNYTAEDALFLMSIGVNIPKYLDPEKRVKKVPETLALALALDANAAAATSEASGTATSGTTLTGSTGSGVSNLIGWSSNYLPWEKKQFTFFADGKTYTGSEINQLEGRSDLQQYFKDFKFTTNTDLKALAKKGYKYCLDITDAVGHQNSKNPGNTVLLLKDKYDRRDSIVYRKINGNWYLIDAVNKYGNGYQLVLKNALTIDGNPIKRLNPISASTNVVTNAARSTFGGTYKYTNADQFSYDLLNTFSQYDISNINYYKDAIAKYFKDMSQNEVFVKATTYSKNKKFLRFPIGKGKYMRIYGGITSKGNGNYGIDTSKITSIDFDNATKKNNNGGILKAQLGYTLGNNGITYREIDTNKKSSTGGRTNVAIGREHREEQLLQLDITGTDLTRLAASLIDLSSVAGSFVPGLHVASTATGAVASLSEFGADMIDVINLRDGVEFWDSVGRLAVNLGMDAISLAPALKTVKGGSALRKVAKVVPHIAGAIQTYNLIADDELRASVGRTLTKIKNLDIDALDTQDFKNIAYLGRTLLAAKNIKGSFKKGSDTGNVKVQGKVKVNGEYKTIEAEMPKDALPSFKGRLAAAQKVLAEKASKLYGKEGEIEFKPEDIHVKSGNLTGRVVSETVRTEIPGQGPKRVFEGWFGSDGLNWRYSDYNLAMTNPYVSKLYGVTPDEKVSKKVKKTNSKEKVNDDTNPKDKPGESKEPVKQEESNNVEKVKKVEKVEESVEAKDQGKGGTDPNIKVKLTPDNAKQLVVQNVNDILSGKANLRTLRSIVVPNDKAPIVGPQLAAKIAEKNKPIALLPLQTETITLMAKLVRKVASQLEGTKKDAKKLSDKELLEKYQDTKQVRQKGSKKITKKQRDSRQKAVLDNLNELYVKYGASEFSKLNNKQKKALGHRYGLSHTKLKSEIAQRYGKELLKRAMPTKLDKLAKQLLGKPLYPSYRFGGLLSYNLIKKLLGGGTPGVDYIEIDGIKYPIKGNESYFKNTDAGYLTFNVYNKDKKLPGYDYTTGLWHKFNGDKETTQIWDGTNFVDYNDDNKWQYQLGSVQDTNDDGISITPWENIPNLKYYLYYGAKPTDILAGSKGLNGTRGLSSKELERDKDLYDDKGNLKEDMSIQSGIDKVNEYFNSGNLTKDATSFLQSNSGKMSMQQAIDLYNETVNWLNQNRKNTFTKLLYAYNTSGGKNYNTKFNSIYTNYPGGFDENLADGQGTSWGQRFIYKTTGGNDPKAQGFDLKRVFEANGVKLFVKEDGTIGKVDANLDTNFHFTDDQFEAMLKGQLKIDISKLTPDQLKRLNTERPDLSMRDKTGISVKFNAEPFLSSISLLLSNSFNLAATNIGKDLDIAKKQNPIEGPGLVFGHYNQYANLLQNKAKALASAEGLTANGRDLAATLVNIHKTYDPLMNEFKKNETENIRSQMITNYDNALKAANKRIEIADGNLALDVAKVNYGKDLLSDFVSQLGNNLKGGVDEARTNMANSRVARQKIEYEKDARNEALDFANNYEQELLKTFGDEAVEWYKTKYNLPNVTATKSVVDEYARHNLSVQDRVTEIRNKYRNIYDTNMSNLGIKYSYVPALPWEFKKYKKRYDFGIGDWVTYSKKGSKLTLSEKSKKKIKEYNKLLESTYKEQMKNIRKDMKTYRALLRTNSAGTLHLLKKLTK